MNREGKKYLLISKEKNLNKNKINYYFYHIVIIQKILIFYLLFFFINYFFKEFHYNKNIFNQSYTKIYLQHKIDYENNIFAIMRRPCKLCGLFSYYKVFLSCIQKYIIKGFIPILEVETYPNVFNGFKANISNKNPWEYFFDQPFGYTFEKVIKNAKKIKYIDCKRDNSTPQYTNFFFNIIKIDFWHDIAIKYIPIKCDIIKDTNNIMKKLFKKSKNILGVLIRGTDYIAKKPKGHPIPPSTKTVIKDIKKMDNINKYNNIFLTTEDYKIREKLINEFGDKLKYILPNKKILYNYKKKIFLSYNKNIKGDLDNLKIYLINILILSKCIDIIACRTNGSVGAYIFTQGYRNSLIYYLGLYPKK